jgi:hypothetical protein
LHKDKLLKLEGKILKVYSTGADFILVDTLKTAAYSLGENSLNFFFLSDSILYFFEPEGPDARYHKFVSVTHSGLSLLPEKFQESSFSFSPIHNPVGVSDGHTIIIARDNFFRPPMSTGTRTHTVYAYDPQSNHLFQQSTIGSLAETKNTGCYLSSSENISYHTQSTVVELFASNVQDSRGYQTALQNRSVYVDSGIPLNSLQNIFVDTTGKRIFVVSTTKLTILNYANTPIGVLPPLTRNSLQGHVLSVQTLKGPVVKFIYPGSTSNRVDLSIYDISGRMIDRIYTLGSNTVIWKPKQNTANCLIAKANNGKEKFVSIFTLKN